MKPYFRPHRHQQRGATLIVALIMLVLITLVTLSTIRSSTSDERMAGNARDRDKALQAAEAAVRSCLNQVITGTYPTAEIKDPVASPSTPLWDVAANWTNDAVSNEVAMTDADLSAPPRCIVERLGAAGSFRVTGRGTGKSASTVVVLQATYSAE